MDLFWLLILLSIPAMILYVVIKQCADATKNPDKYQIVAIYETGSRHYQRGTCLVCFEIHYKDGHTSDEWVDAAGFKYERYKNWNNEHSS